MNVARILVEGHGLAQLGDLLRESIRDCHVYRSADTMVLASEKLYFRIKSNLLSILILNMADEDKCEIEIIAGGGGQAPFGVTWGAESHRTNQMVRLLEEICDSNSWILTKVSG